MADEIINKNHPRIVAAREKSKQAFDSLTALRKSHHIIIDGISFLNDKEVAALLRVTRRTVQNYRDSGIIPYYMIGGKCLYAETDVRRLIDSNYHPRYDSNISE